MWDCGATSPGPPTPLTPIPLARGSQYNCRSVKLQMMPPGEAKGLPHRSFWRGSGTEEKDSALFFMSLVSSTLCSSVTGCIVLIKGLLQTFWAICLLIWWSTKCQATTKMPDAKPWVTTSKLIMMPILMWRTGSKNFCQRPLHLRSPPSHTG